MLTTSGFKIKREDIKPFMIKELTVRPNTGEGFQQLPFFNVYRENNTRYRIPRFYGQQHYPDFKVDASIHACTSIDVPFNGQLKDENSQNEASRCVIDTLNTTGGGVLSLPTGYGKTTVALHVVSKMAVKTLIIVHKEFLMNQWLERIRFFLPDAKVGIIRQNKIEVAGKDIVIGMLQSISMKSYDKSVFAGFGMTVIDETHHICSKTFSGALFNVCTKYILGLSATPERKDGLTRLLYWSMGDVCFKVDRDTSSLNIVTERLTFTSSSYKTTEIPLSVTGKVSVPEIINIITENEERNILIVDRLISFLREGRKTIMMTDRRNHCTTIQKMLIEKGIDDVGLYMGGMKQHDLKISEEKHIILATYSLAHEGLDIPTLDTLLLASPKTDVVQACGRILRTGNVRVHDPYILDIIDTFSVLPRQGKKRHDYYTSASFTVTHSKHPNVPVCKKDAKPYKGYSFVEDIDP
jgi:superfamily II DNA or RNA helicase